MMSDSFFETSDLDREYDNVKKVSTAYFQRHLLELERASQSARAQFQSYLDISYGASPLERLDIFPAKTIGARVHVFFHGGYWQALDKQNFSYIAHGFVPHDITVVVVNFPLLPQVRMARQISACRRALQWVHAHIAEYGGDPMRLSVSGHSAGGHLAAMLLTNDGQSSTAVAPSLQHVCLLSGIYDLAPIQRSFVNHVLQLTDDEVQACSPINWPKDSTCSLHILVGANEGVAYIEQSKALYKAWTSPHQDIGISLIDDGNHFSMREQLGSPDSEIVRHILNAIECD